MTILFLFCPPQLSITITYSPRPPSFSLFSIIPLCLKLLSSIKATLFLSLSPSPLVSADRREYISLNEPKQYQRDKFPKVKSNICHRVAHCQSAANQNFAQSQQFGQWFTNTNPYCCLHLFLIS